MYGWNAPTPTDVVIKGSRNNSYRKINQQTDSAANTEPEA